jgi:hypothetical protein
MELAVIQEADASDHPDPFMRQQEIGHISRFDSEELIIGTDHQTRQFFPRPGA